jgi:predicted NUDIX family phosphoesterase
MDEKVLCFPAKLLDDIGRFQGFKYVLTGGYKYMDLLKTENLAFLERSKAENDPSYKQVIPYCVIDRISENGKKETFVYERTTNGGESRLHNLYSLGVGGHINDGDYDKDNCLYVRGLQRELDEEIGLPIESLALICGFINDDSNDVGKVHFGVVHTILVNTEDKIICREASLTNGQFRDMIWLRENINKFENWSKLFINNWSPDFESS